MASPPSMFPAWLVAADGITAVFVSDINGYNAAIAAGATYSTVAPATTINASGGGGVTTIVAQLPFTSGQSFPTMDPEPQDVTQ